MGILLGCEAFSRFAGAGILMVWTDDMKSYLNDATSAYKLA